MNENDSVTWIVNMVHNRKKNYKYMILRRHLILISIQQKNNQLMTKYGFHIIF